MTLDGLALGLAVLFAILGWRSGALSQCFRVLAAVAAFFGASPLAAYFQRRFMQPGEGNPVFDAVLLVGSAVVLYVAVAVAAWACVRALWAASDRLSTLDRTGGLLLGLLKASIIVYFLVSAMTLVQGALEEADPDDDMHVRDSRLLGVVERYNVLLPWRFGDLARLHDAIAVGYHLEGTSGSTVLERRSAARRLLESERMRRLLEQDALVRAALHGRYYVTLADRRVRRMLDDPKFVARLRATDWQTLRREVAAGEQHAELTPSSTTLQRPASRFSGCRPVRRSANTPPARGLLRGRRR